MLMQQPIGNYTFIKGIGPFCSGCKAQPGYEIVHARFHPQPDLQAGFGLIERHLQSLGRPIQALCGMELRIPQSLSAQAFAEFNAPYITRLTDWELPVDGVNPVARTNVAPASTRPPNPGCTASRIPCPASTGARRLSCPARPKPNAGPTGVRATTL